MILLNPQLQAHLEQLNHDDSQVGDEEERVSERDSSNLAENIENYGHDDDNDSIMQPPVSQHHEINEQRQYPYHPQSHEEAQCRQEISHLLGSICAPSLSTPGEFFTDSPQSPLSPPPPSLYTELLSFTNHQVSLIRTYDTAIQMLTKATTIHLGLGQRGISPSVRRVEQSSLWKEVSAMEHNSKGDVIGMGKQQMEINRARQRNRFSDLGSYSTLTSKTCRKRLFQSMECQFNSLQRLSQSLTPGIDQNHPNNDYSMSNEKDKNTDLYPSVQQGEKSLQPHLFTISSLTTVRHQVSDALSECLSSIFVLIHPMREYSWEVLLQQIEACTSICKEQSSYLNGCFPTVPENNKNNNTYSMVYLRESVDALATAMWALEDSMSFVGDEEGCEENKNDVDYSAGYLQNGNDFKSWWSNLSASIKSLSDLYDAMGATLFPPSKDDGDFNNDNNSESDVISLSSEEGATAQEEYNHVGKAVVERDENQSYKEDPKRNEKTIIFTGKGKHSKPSSSCIRRVESKDKGSDLNSILALPTAPLNISTYDKQLLLSELQSRLEKVQQAPEFEVPERENDASQDNLCTSRATQNSSSKTANPFFLGLSGSALTELKGLITFPTEKSSSTIEAGECYE